MTNGVKYYRFTGHADFLFGRGGGKLSYFWHFMRRQGSLGKTIMLGKLESSRKRGRPNMRGIDSIKEAVGMSPQELSKVVEDRTL